jgi:hypothetical protein
MPNPEKTKVALVQMRCGPTPDANLAHALDLIGEAAKGGAQIVCLPELFRSQYFCQSEDHDNFSLAESIPGPSTDALTKLAREKSIVIVASLFEKRAASVIQPDITHCGGLSEARRIAAMAEAYRVAMAPHNPQGPVSTAASLEFGFSTPSYIICETVHSDVPWRSEVVKEGFTVEKKGRIVRPNTRPGLGIEINEDEVRKHPFQQELVQRVFYKDGSAGDW